MTDYSPTEVLDALKWIEPSTPWSWIRGAAWSSSSTPDVFQTTACDVLVPELAKHKNQASLWRSVVGTEFDGSVSGLEELVVRVQAAKEAAETRAGVLDEAIAKLPAVAVGATGESLQGAVTAFRDVARLHRDGLETFGAGVEAYAQALEQADQLLANQVDALIEAAGNVNGLSVDTAGCVSAFSLSSEESYLAGVVNSANELADAALDTIRTTCHSLIEAEDAFNRVVVDAGGYAVLADMTPPAGLTMVDVVCLRSAIAAGDLAAYQVGDPDVRVLSDAEWARAVARWNGLSDTERAALNDAVSGASSMVRALVMSALATGAPLSAVLALAARLKSADKDLLREIAGLGALPNAEGRDPTQASVGADPFIQYSGTTCGPTTITAFLAASDPFVALWLSTGELAAGHTPSFLQGVDLSAAGATGASRATYLQNAVQVRVNTFVNTWNYPRGLGIAPGPVPKELSFSGVEYGMEWVNSLAVNGDQGLARSLDSAVASLSRGTPVPLLVGTHFVPRHYVLAVGYRGDQFAIFDPGDGLVEWIDSGTLKSPDLTTAQPALGRWERVHVVYLPK